MEKQKMTRDEVEITFARLLYEMEGVPFDEVLIAGSYRRGLQLMGDIDIVMRLSDVDACDRQMNFLIKSRKIVKQVRADGAIKAWGKLRKSFIFDGKPVEIYGTHPEHNCHAITMLLRTGPGDANKLLVSPRSKGGLLPEGYCIAGGSFLWLYDRKISVRTELDFFRTLGYPYVEPKDRSVATYRKLLRGKR